MFASQDIGARKVFQKPNILRRKPAKKKGTLKTVLQEDKQVKRVQVSGNLPSNLLNQDDFSSFCHEKITWGLEEVVQPAQQSNILSFTIKNVSKPTEELEENETRSSESHLRNSQIKPEYLFFRKPTLHSQEYNNEEEESSINIELFLVNSKKKNTMPNDQNHSTGRNMETDVENKWCLNFMSEDLKDMVMPNFYDPAQLKISNENSKDVELTSKPNEISSSKDSPNVSEQEMIIQSCLNSRVVKYKCDVPNCNKSFWNDARLQKHKQIHNKQKSPNVPGIIECPVKQVDDDGLEQPCGHMFSSRDDLMKHLNEDHVPEDASYKCEECGRHFWWATGLRTHAQSTCTRALLCPWSGCGRVFRQPCRLREHARAHNGDRPYPCNYPNCGWAFRSASKLHRHARRHTGEKRHECAACGRAFPRRDHLRDHAARHHAPRQPHHCTVEGCEQAFANTNSLCMHLKKVHNVVNKKTATSKKPAVKKPAAPKKPASPKKVATPKTPKKVAKSAPKKTKVMIRLEVEGLPEAVSVPELKMPETKNMLMMTLDGGALIKYGYGDPSFTLSDAIETAKASVIIERETHLKREIHTFNQLENEHGQLLNEHDQVLNEHVQIMNEQGQVVNEHGQIVDEHGQLLDEHEQLLEEHEQLLDEHEQLLDEHGQIVTNEEQLLNENRQIVNEHDEPENEHGELMNEYIQEKRKKIVIPCEYELEGKCARTHFTWPLQRAPGKPEAQTEPEFSIEDDTQVEQCENSENNNYTVRSDLFLHGNVLINEDSEFIIRESNRAGEAEEGGARLDHLGLIDAHPTIDLMPDELYADVAGDESSFRVFMLNTNYEELS